MLTQALSPCKLRGLPPGRALFLAFTSVFLFVFLALVGPGLGLQRAVRARPDPGLVLPLGLLCCATLYASSLRLAEPWIFPLGILLINTPNLLPFMGLGARPESTGSSRR